MSVAIQLRTLEIPFSKKFELSKNKISIVSEVKKNRRIRTKSMHMSQPYLKDIFK